MTPLVGAPPMALGSHARGRRRLMLLSVLAALQRGERVLWACADEARAIEAEPELRRQLRAEGATEAELRRFTVGG